MVFIYYFLDSSALAKLYNPESGTPRVDLIAQSLSNRLVISTLAEIEIRSAFAIRVRSAALTRPEGSPLIQQFREDIVSNRFEISPASDADFKDAGKLMERHAFDHRLRTLDALQLAVALKLKRAEKLDYFVSADKVLCEVAALEGLAVVNPDAA